MMADRIPPKPWFGCDTNSEEWRAYCEAWEWAFRKKSPRLPGLIHDIRGKDALDKLRENVRLVKREYRGEIDDRADIPRLLRL